MNRRVTQQDIARRMGLDKSTVSLALRNHRSIAENTRRKVQAMANELGYRPDPALATLARQRWAGHETGSGAALVYLIDSRMENFPTHGRFLAAARQRAEQRGYLLTAFDLAEYSTIAAAARVLQHRGIRGLLVPQFAHTTGPGILDLPADNFTVVCLDLGWVAAPFHIVAPDTFETTRRVWREAVERGYRRIGGAILSHAPRAVDDAARFGASVSAQEEWLRSRERIPLLTSDHRDRDAFLRWLDRYQPEVVIGFISRVYEWICSTGRRVPQDVAFAALAVVIEESPQLSGALRQEKEIGAVGVDALIAGMSEGEWGAPPLQRKLLLEPTWHEGETLPRRGG
jgi:DNA-binding LacI/PurR family transcriptional regulator